MTSRAIKKFDVILLGATGYTGKLCAEYITTSLGTNLSWAIAGRNETRLSHLLKDLELLNPDRVRPAIEVVSLAPKDLESLVQKTKVVINTIGPYYLYSTPILEACAKYGAHYLDATGESPWVAEMISKHHEIAKGHQAIIIPGVGIESAPSDLLAWALIQLIRRELFVGTTDVIACVHDVHGAPSGGTLATVIGIIDHYSMKDLAKASGRWTSSPVAHPHVKTSESTITKFFGFRNVHGLGTLTTSVSAGPNVATVQRSWGLFEAGKFYGPKFQYYEYAAVRNFVVAVAIHFGLALGALALLIPPVRWLAKRIVYAPGEGPTKEASSRESIEFRAIATADQNIKAPKRAFGRLRWDGGLYYLTGLFLAEAAMVLLENDDLVRRLDGGLLTPATLEQPFIDRLKKAGVVIEAELIQD